MTSCSPSSRMSTRTRRRRQSSTSDPTAGNSPSGDYEYTTLERRYEKEPGVTPFLPQLVVIYLGTNDVSFTRGISVREQHFVRRYIDLINDVRKFYTGARVLVLYGMMDQQLMEACRYAAGYTGSDFLELPLMNPAEEGIGCGQHPSPLTHRLAAEKIADYAGEVLGWERYASPCISGWGPVLPWTRDPGLI